MQANRYREPRPNASEISRRLGLHQVRHEWRGDCPACGYVGAAVLDERQGRALLWCASCQDKAALGRALRDAGGGSLPLTDRVERLPRARPDAASRTERAQGLWAGAEPITPDCPAGLYLKTRKIEHALSSPALRWRSDVPHPAGGRRLALVARIDGPDGNLQAVQRIYLDRDGAKAAVEPQKASLGTVAGGAVRLQPCSTELVIAEGIESAAAAGAILGLPAWAAVSCGNLAKSLILPPEIRSVTVAADHDAPGLQAAEDAAARWKSEGRGVRIVKAVAAGCDFNDLVIARAAGGVP